MCSLVTSGQNQQLTKRQTLLSCTPSPNMERDSTDQSPLLEEFGLKVEMERNPEVEKSKLMSRAEAKHHGKRQQHKTAGQAVTSVAGKEGLQSHLLARDEQEANRERNRSQEPLLEWEAAGEITVPF